MLVLLESLLPN